MYLKWAIVSLLVLRLLFIAERYLYARRLRR